MKLKHFAAALAVATGVFAQAETTVGFGYATESQLYLWGTGKAETYDIAIYIDNPEVVGKNITGVKVPVVCTDNITGFKVWLTSKLGVDANKQIVTNITSADVTPQEDGESYIIDYTFDQKYTVPAGGIYVGYSFTVDKVSTQYEQYPALVTEQVVDNGFWLHSSRTYRAWKDKSEVLGCTSAITAMIEGDYPDCNVSLLDAPMAYSKIDETNTIDFTVYNYGAKAVESVDYTLTVKNKKYTGSYTFETPIPNMLGRKGTLPVEFPAKGKGNYNYTLTIDKVNGQDNESPEKTIESTYSVFAEYPVNRPVMEEFTGTWCGWCVRGWMAMEKMNEFYPDLFIGLAYHNGDPMQIAGTNGIISQFASGFPSCTINRLEGNLDPYYANSNNGFGVKDYWENLHNKFNPCAVNVIAGWTDDNHTSVNATAQVTFLTEVPDNEYRIEYVLVGNKIVGTGTDSWLQHNYYAGGSAGCPEYMEPFVNGDYRTSLVNIPFNDVVLATTGSKGVKGSLDNYAIGKTRSVDHVFENVPDIKSTFQGYTSSPIPFNTDELYVVAMVLDMSKGGYGTVINTGRAKVSGINGIGNVTLDASRSVDTVTYYDLSGRQVANPKGGIYIRSTRYTDGTVNTDKVALK